MITNFGTLYAGHIDLDDIGLQGVPVNDRRFHNDRIASAFEKAEAIAKVLDKNGYDIFWLAEHHFQHEGYECIPNILMLSTHLAHLTKRIRFGCGFNVTPMWHPLRLAEDYATADILTGGRVVFGAGRGYHTREVEVFGAPLLDREANRDLFEEQMEIIFKAFNQDSFSHRGKHYNIPPEVPYRGYQLKEITLVPRPLNTPVECWQPIVSASQRGLDFMVKHGIKGIIGGGLASDQVVKAWRDVLSRSGNDRKLGEDLLMGFSFHIAETEEKAIKEARVFFEENLKMFAPLGLVKGITEEQLQSMGDPSKAPFTKFPTIEEAVKNGAWLCGPPELIIEKLMDVQDRYPGLEYVNVGNAIGTPQSVIEEQLEWFGKEIIPAFKG